jgi:sugar-specific transcriptional regulator TrmB
MSVKDRRDPSHPTHQGDLMLEALGLSAVEEAVYLALLRTPHLPLSELAAELGRGQQTIRAAVSHLEEVGFVTRLPGVPTQWAACRPEVAVDALVERRTDELAQVQVIARELSAQVPKQTRARPDELVEIVQGRAAVAARFVQLEQGISEELLVLDRPPYAQDVSRTNAPETDLLDRGINVRGIYAPEAFELPGGFEQARLSVEAGEEARVHADVPMKLAVGDRAVALLPMTLDGIVDSALVIRASMVVSALVGLFEALWNQACPLPSWQPGQGLAADEAIDTEVLALLATGMTDEAIARELGISVRTLGRRTSRLLGGLGARTRFQAGMQAGHRGLV